MIARLLLEKIPLAGIARVLQLSQSWLQHYVNVCYDNVPRSVQVTPKPLLKKTTLERCSMICSRCKLPLRPVSEAVVVTVLEAHLLIM